MSTFTCSMIRSLKLWLACRRLNRLVAKHKRDGERYAMRRQAAKLGWARRRMA